MIREELRAFRSSNKVPESRKKYSSPRSEQSSEVEDKDSDGSQEVISSEGEQDTCFPTDSIDNLVKSVRNTMGMEDTKTLKTPQDVMFAGLSERKRPSFPVIPAIKDLVRKEWDSQGQKGLPSSSKRRYPFNDEDFSKWSKAPKVDAAVASTSRKSLLPVEDSGSLQDPLDRKADSLLKRAWESCTGAFRPAISATCTARSMLVWLNDLEEGLKGGLSRNKLMSSIPLIRGATAFLADSSADSIRLTAKSAGLTNAARRALWLKGWKGDPQTKSKLCGLPCQGEYLFGTQMRLLPKRVRGRKGSPITLIFHPIGERSESPCSTEDGTIKTRTVGLIKTLSKKEPSSENALSNLRINPARTDLPVGATRNAYKNPFRQHDSSSIYKPPRRNKIRSTHVYSQRHSSHSRGAPSVPISATCERNRQFESRFPQSPHSPPRRMGSKSSYPRRPTSAMGIQEGICLSSADTTSDSNQEDKGGQSKRDLNSSVLAQEAMVFLAESHVNFRPMDPPGGSGSSFPGPLQPPSCEGSSVNSLEFERQLLKMRGFSNKVIDTLLLSRKKSTTSIYARVWRKFLNLYPTALSNEIHISMILEFLQKGRDLGLAVSTFKSTHFCAGGFIWSRYRR
ncbi:uncharacterized protein [Ranitomeya imitator]|uniref:uncharacterized protein isoform X2 n=1 Tax=Ranitomeya imitator TaxID=111125 RepID=UPI0037E864CD